ncbi:MAG: FRG domain-containing protein [Faecousia sp.]
MDLFQLSAEDDTWNEHVREELANHEHHHGGGRVDFILDEIRALNVAGTVVSWPHGDMITFPSRQHLFRGENKIHQETVPSLNRKIAMMSDVEKELYRAITNMRIEQFCKFLWTLQIVPYWEAQICDVNYKALAQHYGFETHLLDLTNDFRTALFFATCRYDRERYCYFPLTEEDIEQNEASKYGIIFHTPSWQLDALQPLPQFQVCARLAQALQDAPIQIDSGLLDGIAWQIGFQPLQRCHSQSGYLLPMRDARPLQEDCRFEKLRFRQSAIFSQKIFELMDGGKKVFPYEGISRARNVLSSMQKSWIFSEDDLKAAYEVWGVNRTLFPTLDDLRSALQSAHFKGGVVFITAEDVNYHIPRTLIDEINAEYNSIDLLQIIGDTARIKPEQKKRRDQRCIQIYGKLI